MEERAGSRGTLGSSDSGRNIAAEIETTAFPAYEIASRARRTEEAYVHVYRFVRHQRLRHPQDMGEREVLAFLTHLAVDRKLAAATQAQAQAALQFLYRYVVDRPLTGLGTASRARAPVRLPVVLSEAEVSSPANRPRIVDRAHRAGTHDP
jgi:site-specific recombinase XerD